MNFNFLLYSIILNSLHFDVFPVGTIRISKRVQVLDINSPAKINEDNTTEILTKKYTLQPLRSLEFISSSFICSS